MTASIIVNAHTLRDYCQALFESVGMAAEEAYANADSLVDADLKGIDSHGVSRMPIHLKRIRLGVVKPSHELTLVNEAPSAAVFDAGNSMGALVSLRAMDYVMAKAKTTGVAFATVKNSNHYGTAGYYVEQAIKQGMIGFSATNGMARMAPWGGRAPFFGTNPFAVGVPADKELPIIVDMATSLVARGKIVIANQNKQTIPLGWALNKDGEDTTDPAEALVGTVLPFAGAKGSAIALLIDVMTGILSGSVYGPHVKDMYADFSNPTGTSHIFGAINVEAFIPAGGFRRTVDTMIREIKSSQPAKNVTEIFLPGEIEQRKRLQRLQDGVPLSAPVYNDLKREGEVCGIPFTLAGSEA